MSAFPKVAVLMGGISSERPVSFRSGAAIAQGLRDAGHDVAEIGLDTAAIPDLSGFDAAFIALHGRFGEDGAIQALLDAARVPYTGPGAEASRISFDKILSRRVLQDAGLPVAKGFVLRAGEAPSAIPLSLPFVVKPPREGSSVGVTIVRDAADIAAAVEAARAKSPEGDILVEDFIPGREWTVGLVGGEPYPVIDIAAKLDGGWYSWKSKYESGGTTVYSFPGDDPAMRAATERCRELAAEAFRALGCRGMGRIDMRVTPDFEPYILEMNTIPGFTATSLLPKAAAKAGLSFSQLCDRILSLAAFGA